MNLRLQTKLKQLLNWALQDKHKAKIHQWRTEVEKAFTTHPEATGETYLEHLWFTLKLSSRFAYTCMVIIIHGIFPFLCTRTASNQIERVYRIMKTRIPVKRREEIDQETRRPVRIDSGGQPRIAIAGGGFSGALTLANIIQQAAGDLAIEWFEPDTSLGLGVAYGTKDPAHLLNVRTDRMGAFAGQPEGFWQWLQSEAGKAKAQALCRGRALGADSFAPRMLYAEYVRAIVSKSLDEAKSKGIDVRITHAAVTDASLHNGDSQQLMLMFQREGVPQEIRVDAMVLATGNLRPRDFHFQADLRAGERSYIDNSWNIVADPAFSHHVHALSADSDIVIIGSGLTMVDTVLTLQARGYKGAITAISRNGLLPAAHAAAKPYPAWDWVLAPQFAPRTTLSLLTRLKQEVARAETQGYDWRDVIDSIRPVTTQLWKQLDIREKRRFLARLFTLWNVHRHRMSPDIHGQLKHMQQSGALNLIAGKIYYVGSDKEGLTVAYRKRGTNRFETLRPALVINCTGPTYDIANSGHPLLRRLRDRELITVGPLRVGLEVTSYGTAKGKAADALFPIGTLLVGEWLECTAVPELREQARDVAQKVLERLQSLYAQDYKAALAVGQDI